MPVGYRVAMNDGRPVQSIRIDDCLAAPGNDRLSIARIGPGMNPPRVLDGFPRTLAEGRPDLLFDRLSPDVAQTVFEILRKSEYRFYVVDDDACLIRTIESAEGLGDAADIRLFASAREPAAIQAVVSTAGGKLIDS